jgi:hypothetical protein
MTIEDRLRSLRLEADAAPLRASVLGVAVRARREQKVWRWTSVAAAAVLAIAIPVNLAVDRVGAAIAVKPVSEKIVPADVREALRTRSALASTKPVRPRTLEEIR